MAATSLRAVLVTVMNFINTFVANTNNPTGVTAAQAGTYTRDELDNLLAKKMAYSDVPIAYWGQALDFPINLSMSGSTLSIATQVPALLAGVRTVLSTLSTTVPVTSGAKNYLYLTVNNGRLIYNITATETAESSTMMYLATITGNGTTGTITDGTAVIQIGGKRLSNTRRGNAIPVSDNTGALSW